MITKLLDQLAESQAALDALNLDYNAKREAILASVKAQLDALDAEYEAPRAAGSETIAHLTEDVKTAVLREGDSVRGQFCQAVYMKGRVSWDTKALEGYSAAHPEISAFRKVGEPSVSIRWNK